MEKRQRTEYNKKDSSIIFLLVIILPQLVAFAGVLLLSGICMGYGMTPEEFEKNIFVKIFEYCAIYLSFALSYYFYNKKNNIHQTKASHFSFKKINVVWLLLVLLIGLVCLFGFNMLSDLVANVFKKIGYSVSAIDFETTNIWRFLLVEIAVAIFPAILEEFTMRGVIFHGFEKDYGSKKAILLSALLFMLMHLSLAQSVYQFFMGVVFAIIVLLTKNIFYSIMAHFFNNFVIILDYFINYGKETVSVEYTTFMDYFLPIAIAIITVVLVSLLLLLLKKLTAKNGTQQVEEIAKTEDDEMANLEVKDQSQVNSSANEVLPANMAVRVCFGVGIALWIFSVLMGFIS